MASNRLDFTLGFTADTSQAIAEFSKLKSSLQELNAGAVVQPNRQLTSELQTATEKAQELRLILNSATNIKTGNLDLSKFNAELNKSKMTLQDYGAQLNKLGPSGAAAFNQLISSVNKAEMPIKRVNQTLHNFGAQLARTAQWSLSSSIINNITGAFQKAIGYAEDLNQSLNDIRIVSGASVDEMANFATEANKAAKTLSASTLDYTNASLIFYQQGLSDQEVQERTEITLKMAHAANQSAETVSDQLTAVWNNYAKGSEDLEHFADAMVKLGADTASSSDEIAEGLEKFAAIGDTVGLSFDNAAAALTTVTATTRQSADVVGTAFKTLFARIQDLELGDTLEDGTTLGKYSEALNAVGINIKQSNGELKDMDDILYEMGTKWNTISKDQQVALAQTVAGKLIVLMLA